MIADLSAMTDALFCKVTVSNLFQEQGGIFYDSIPVHAVAKLVSALEDRYQRHSELDCDHLVQSLSRYLWSSDIASVRAPNDKEIHVFSVLEALVRRLLTVQNGTVVCRYQHILHWRNLVQSVGEDLPIAAMYVLQDMALGRQRTFFTWSCVTEHDNVQLNQVLQRGYSEHHMHLYASVPYFQISWINLMNQIDNTSYSHNLQRIAQQEWNLSLQSLAELETLELLDRQHGQGIYGKDSIVTRHRQAALIRLYLFSRLTNSTLNLIPSKAKKNSPEELSNAKWTERYVFYLLRNTQELYLASPRIQSIIDSFQRLNNRSADYVAQRIPWPIPAGQEGQIPFASERWFLYSVLRDIYQANPVLSRAEQNLFFAYLLIKIQIRSSMVQVNSRVGFDNFQKIQRRKSYFWHTRSPEREVMQQAVLTPLKQDPHFREIEVRITPAETSQQLHSDLCALESASGDDPSLRMRYYYVLHFSKQRDTSPLRGLYSNDYYAQNKEYRHFTFRKRLERQAHAIYDLRRQAPHLASRVRGIDACSQEIGCRPENFAYVFRVLGNDTCTLSLPTHIEVLPKLYKTYHVGEDFLDLSDGLRAIDEAIRFLNLSSGDRLGHALALCIPAADWYEAKKKQISLPAQDYLDNIAWLYGAVHHYHLEHQTLFLRFLRAEFDRCFRKVYQNAVQESALDLIAKEAELAYKGKPFASNYVQHRWSFSIEDYIHSWMLRGDHPERYVSGYYQIPDTTQEMLLWELHKENASFPIHRTYRYIPECSMLYYLYHYNPKVKEYGSKPETVQIESYFIQGVQEIQYALQRDIAEMGITVESNPTSNTKIGTFRFYWDHPALALYNKGLVHTPKELHACPQIPISINTDDSGVFFTSLKNEYAVFARALELLKDESGSPLYRSWEVLDWLNQVRIFGNEQSFQ